MNLLEKNLQLFENYLEKNLPKVKSFHPHYEEALGYMMLCGGKRFRPMLLLKVLEHEAPLLLENALPVALAVEMLHTYSLIHDDLPAMDNSPLRRGRETLHLKYDEVTAILIGDALNTHSFYLIANAPLDPKIKCELIKTLALKAGIKGMVLGQALDCHFENSLLDLNSLEFLHINKTAKLIAAALKMGMIIAGCKEDRIKIVEEFGIKLGLAFQIKDDLIDATKSEEEAGKPTGNDEVKNSFTNLLGVWKSTQILNEMIIELKTFCDKIGGSLGEELYLGAKSYLKKG